MALSMGQGCNREMVLSMSSYEFCALAPALDHCLSLFYLLQNGDEGLSRWQSGKGTCC